VSTEAKKLNRFRKKNKKLQHFCFGYDAHCSEIIRFLSFTLLSWHLPSYIFSSSVVL